jgi:sugar phosphate isomerase/epimerase
MNFRDGLGFDAGGTRLEDALTWAAVHGFHYVDFNADRQPNRLDMWDTARCQTIREQCARHHIQIGLHTMSGVNVAEFSPYVSDAVDAYLQANIALAQRLGCPWMIVHAGYHFSSQVEARQEAALAHLQRAVAHAEQAGVRLLLENMNFEPADAEVHYLGHTVAECRYYFDAIASAHFGWAFTVNHAHLVPEGVGGFLDAFGPTRIGEVRLADNLGDKEEHLKPGEGNIDFTTLLQRLESSGYAHHYMMAFGTQADLLAGRDYLAACVR